MATSNINFTITKPSLGYDITDNVLAPSEIVTKRDVNKLNITLVGFTGPTSLTVDLVFPNGTIQKDLHLISTVENPNVFYRVLNDIYDDMEIAQGGELIIDRICINDSGLSYTTTNDYSIELISSDNNNTYTPNDMDVLFMENAKLKSRLLKLESAINFIDLTAAPDNNGTYVLTCEVINGIKKYKWEIK